MDRMVPLPKLPQAQRRTRIGFCSVSETVYTLTRGEITKFSSSPGTRRGFCSQCGSTLTCENTRLPTETHFHVGAFDDATRFRPTRHIFPEERLPLFHTGEE